MVQYIYILIFNLILAKYFKKIKNFSLTIITLSFTLFFSLRWGVGTDFYNYYTGFFRYGVQSIEILLKKDSLFYFLVKILYMITNKNYLLYQFIIGFLIYFPLIYVYKKKSNSFENTIFFFQTLTTAFFPLNGVRQALAGSLGLVSIYFYTKSPNKLKSLIFFILAVSIHNSAIILLLIPILVKIKPNKENIIKIIIIFTVMLIFFEKVYTLGINSFTIFGNQKMISDYGNLRNLRKGVNILTILFQFFPIILYYAFYKKYINKRKYIYINSSIIIFLIYLLGIKINLIIRFAYYFQLLLPLFYSEIFLKIKDNKIKLLIYLLMFFHMIIYINISGGIVPYKIIKII